MYYTSNVSSDFKQELHNLRNNMYEMCTRSNINFDCNKILHHSELIFNAPIKTADHINVDNKLNQTLVDTTNTHLMSKNAKNKYKNDGKYGDCIV
uniref:Ac5-like protein n=1 Tax=Iragoides fasciata nucleopolyhedrovirus TaxID=571205 RepID=B6VC28_9ABAC|nr:Ac5-like protein [Iragoides fasciata nucleopolyhedrovirus]